MRCLLGNINKELILFNLPIIQHFSLVVIFNVLNVLITINYFIFHHIFMQSHHFQFSHHVLDIVLFAHLDIVNAGLFLLRPNFHYFNPPFVCLVLRRFLLFLCTLNQPN
jgi:hypothetical protein